MLFNTSISGRFLFQNCTITHKLHFSSWKKNSGSPIFPPTMETEIILSGKNGHKWKNQTAATPQPISIPNTESHLWML